MDGLALTWQQQDVGARRDRASEQGICTPEWEQAVISTRQAERSCGRDGRKRKRVSGVSVSGTGITRWSLPLPTDAAPPARGLPPGGLGGAAEGVDCPSALPQKKKILSPGSCWVLPDR